MNIYSRNGSGLCKKRLSFVYLSHKYIYKKGGGGNFNIQWKHVNFDFLKFIVIVFVS